MELHWFDIITILMFIIFVYGSIYNAPYIFVQLNFIIKVLIGIYLIYRFNEFKRVNHITLLDQKICGSAGAYILIFSFADAITVYLQAIRNFIMTFV